MIWLYVLAAVALLLAPLAGPFAPVGGMAPLIQELAGHQELSTTQRYMHLSPAAIESAIRLLEEPSPVSKFGGIVETASGENAKGKKQK